MTLFHNKVLQLNYASILRHFSQFWKIGSYMSKCLTITAVKNFKLSDSTSEILYGSLHGSPFLIIIIASRKQKLWVCICLNSTLIACRIVLSPNITWTYKLVQRRVIDVLRLVNAILKGLVIGCSGSNMGRRHYAFLKGTLS